uniref:NADH dehydrogenase subunit 4L n=1 Tax=Pallisentis celatus TaxID=935648 RepID=V5IXB2_PALCE|nr:NADH dehydrogenase subunit 4L [Pallisentis celatus]AFK50136.1 NADH dehydrogenase subunit 4L [Pallisentis celatus]
MLCEVSVVFFGGLVMMVLGVSVVALLVSLEITLLGVLVELLQWGFVWGFGSLVFVISVFVLGVMVSFVLVVGFISGGSLSCFYSGF